MTVSPAMANAPQAAKMVLFITICLLCLAKAPCDRRLLFPVQDSGHREPRRFRLREGLPAKRCGQELPQVVAKEAVCASRMASQFSTGERLTHPRMVRPAH